MTAMPTTVKVSKKVRAKMQARMKWGETYNDLIERLLR